MTCNDYTIFCKNTLHKSYNCTTYSNITIKRTLHKLIITHITFIFTKRSFFKQFNHMMHTIDTQLLCRHLGCHSGHRIWPRGSRIWPRWSRRCRHRSPDGGLLQHLQRPRPLGEGEGKGCPAAAILAGRAGFRRPTPAVARRSGVEEGAAARGLGCPPESPDAGAH